MRRVFLSFAIAAALGQAPTAQTVTLTGRVTAADGAPLARVRVTAQVPDGAVSRPLQTVMTDDRGGFDLTLPGSGIELVFVKAGYAVERVRASAAPLVVRLARSATIAGRVTDQAGDPALGVSVYVWRLPIGDASTPEVGTDTDDLGEYRIGGLPEGRYAVVARLFDGPPGGKPPAGAEVPIGLAAGDLASVDFTVDVPVGVGVPAEVTLMPEDSGTIRGRVINSSGRPVAGAVVRARRPAVPIRFAISGADGRYTVSGVSAGEYQVDASKDLYIERGRLVSVRPGQTVEGIDIALPRPGAIAGRVVDERGEPLQSVMVEVLQVKFTAGSPRAVRVGGRLSDDRGQYRVFGLQPGTYVVRARVNDRLTSPDARGYAPVYFPGVTSIDQAARIDLALGSDRPATDLIVGPAPAVRVTGTAVDSRGAPAQGPVLLAVSERSRGLQQEPVQTRPEADGSFVFTNVPPGDYVVQALGPPSGGRLALVQEFASQFVTVGDTSPPPLALRTSPGASVSGRILVDGGAARISSLYLLMAQPTDLDRSPRTATALVPFRLRQDGTFGEVGLNGLRQFRLNGAPAGWYLKSVVINGEDVTDTPVDFGRGDTIDGLEVAISTRGATIAGAVSDDRAAPVNAYTVIVFPTQRDRWQTASRFMKFAVPTQDGTFRVTGLPPGDYWFAAVDKIDTEPGGEWQSPDVLESLVSRASRVGLGEGETHTASLRLIRR